MIKIVTVNDIKTTNESTDNKVRKSWVLAIPDDYKQRLQSFPGQVKMQFYRDFDKQIHELWVKKLAEANQAAKDAGAKLVGKDGLKHFEETYCVNPDEVLIEAAKEVLIKFIEQNPLNAGTV